MFLNKNDPISWSGSVTVVAYADKSNQVNPAVQEHYTSQRSGTNRPVKSFRTYLVKPAAAKFKRSLKRREIMTVRELITQLLDEDMDKKITIEVWDDGELASIDIDGLTSDYRDEVALVPDKKLRLL